MIHDATQTVNTLVLWGGFFGVIIGGVMVLTGIVMALILATGTPQLTLTPKHAILCTGGGLILFICAAFIYIQAGGTLILGPVHIGPA